MHNDNERLPTGQHAPAACCCADHIDPATASAGQAGEPPETRMRRRDFLLRAGALPAPPTQSRKAAIAEARRRAPGARSHLVRSDKPELLRWGFLPNRDAAPVLTIRSGDIVTVETISHEGSRPTRAIPVSSFPPMASRLRRSWRINSRCSSPTVCRKVPARM